MKQSLNGTVNTSRTSSCTQLMRTDTYIIHIEDLQMHDPRCVLCKLERGRHVKTQLNFYYVYYDDMFRPLWAILRSQNHKEKYM